MKKFRVYVPIAGYIQKEVEADTKDDAIEEVLNDGFEYDDIQELEIYNKITDENKYQLPQIESYAEEIKED
jgi:hypothetical protein